MSYAILYDSTMCVGCKACEEGCTKKWGMPYNETVAAEEFISAHKLTAIETHGERYSRRLCQHCQDPTCASVCPVKALTKSPEGPVVYDETRCMGCRYCMQACPFQVPTYEWSSRTPRIKKCNMCIERQTTGKPTACTEACPTNATICGQRDDLIAEARRRIAEKPSEYYNRIYGIREAGGTSVFYLAAVPFEQIGLRTNLPLEPLPGLTWRALQFVPDVGSVGATLMGGIYWITHRREAVAKEEGSKGKGAQR
jgi:formate dehydrogenase iron-sulfur subunit